MTQDVAVPAFQESESRGSIFNMQIFKQISEINKLKTGKCYMRNLRIERFRPLMNDIKSIHTNLAVGLKVAGSALFLGVLRLRPLPLRARLT